VDVADAIDRSRLLLDQGRSDDALDLLRSAFQEHPDDEDLKGEIALLFTERGLARPPQEGDLALQDFAEALKHAELPLALVGTAKVLTARGDHGKAEEILGRALEADPELPEALAQMGILRVSQGDFAAGAPLMAAALERAPAYGPGYLWLASALEGMGRPQDAHRALLEGLRHCPADDALLVGLGWSCARHTRDFGSARGSWRRATEINRHNAEAWKALAWGAAAAGDELEMTVALDRATALDPEGTREFLDRSRADQPLLGNYTRS
jgi:tetratricopeptide (TPR) repeat protein